MLVPPWCPAAFASGCRLQDVVTAQKGMALIAAAANKVAAFPEVGTPSTLMCMPILVLLCPTSCTHVVLMCCDSIPQGSNKDSMALPYLHELDQVDPSRLLSQAKAEGNYFQPLDVASPMQEDKADLSNSVQSLVECLEITMMQHPLLAVRNMAFWSLDALLIALQVVHNLTASNCPVTHHCIGTI